MKTRKILWLSLTIMTFRMIVLADSPLTSTPFSSVYSEEKIIELAAGSKGILSNDMMEYLTDPNNPIDTKMALINRIGRFLEKKENAPRFHAFLLREHSFADRSEFLARGTGDDLLSMAYLLAMDNYSEVKEAIKYAELALEKNPNSQTYQLILGLIKAQKIMDHDWCEVYNITDRIRNNQDLIPDMKPEAVKIIYQYMDQYKEFCKETPTVESDSSDKMFFGVRQKLTDHVKINGRRGKVDDVCAQTR